MVFPLPDRGADSSRAMRPKAIRVANTELVLGILASIEWTTRAELAESSSLTAQALGPILAELVEAGLALEQPSQRSGPGRPPSEYALNPDGALRATVFVRFADCAVLISDARGEIVASTRYRLPNQTTPGRVVSRIVKEIARMVNGHGLPPERIRAVDLSVEGEIDELAGTVITATAWKSRNVNIVDRMAKSLPTDAVVTLQSIERVLAASAIEVVNPAPEELVAIVEINHDNRLMIFQGGELVSNRAGSTGDLTHIPVAGNDQRCECGRVGCFGTVSSGRAVVENYERLSGRRVDAAIDVIELVAERDPDAIEAARRAIDWLGQGLAPVIRVLAPDRLIFTGAVGEEGSGGARALEYAIRRHLDEDQSDLTINVVQPSLNNQSLSAMLIR